MKNSRINHVIWDWNGTLVNDAHLCVEIVNEILCERELCSVQQEDYREYFACQKVEDFIDTVFDVAKVKSVVMTNDPFDPVEQPIWFAGRKGDPRFRAALRIDPLLNDYVDVGCEKLSGFGYETDLDLSGKSLSEIRRFLSDWINRIEPNYMAASLPPEFKYPEDSNRGKIIKECVYLF